MNWGEEDGKREIVLRKCLRESMLVDIRKVRTIEEIVGECEADLSCSMVTASRADDGLVGEGGGWDLLSGGQRGVQGAGHQHTGGGWEQQAHRNIIARDISPFSRFRTILPSHS